MHDGRIFVITGADDVFALSIETGEIVWQHAAELDPKIASICCGWTSRGVAHGLWLRKEGRDEFLYLTVNAANPRAAVKPELSSVVVKTTLKGEIELE